jgi:ribosomal protein S18 acetylase RimI-like enzyme
MIKNVVLPEDLTERAATLEDLAAALQLIQAYEMRHYGSVETSLDELRARWTAPNLSLEADSRVVFGQDGRLLAYLLLEHSKHAKYYLLCRMQPDYRDPRLGEYLLTLAETWARERIDQAEPGVRVTLSASLPGSDEEGRQLYERAGLQDVRRFWEMEIEFAAAPPAPNWPADIKLRPYVPGRDERPAFELLDSAFQDHWGHIPNRFAEWKHWTVERPHFDPSLWFIAYQGEQMVGGAFCYLEEQRGWVDDLAVLRAARGQGLGMALLLHAFGEFYRRGLRKAGLGVDSQNLTGALRLYQRAGMHRVQENVSYEKELRAGVELSTRTLAS